MGVQIHERGGNLIELNLNGKLTADEYHEFVPVVESVIEREGNVRILFVMEDFHGWEWGALWEDTKFDLKHHGDISKLAMVGDKKWEEWMATFCRPFVGATIQYFDVSDIDGARSWIDE